MNTRTRLLAAISLAGCSLSVSALEALEDEVLSHVTGQEGITIDQTFKNDIEEFLYVDSDGDGSSGSGRIALVDIKIGNFTGVDQLDNTATTNGMLSITGKKIDAASDGVIITTGHIGSQGDVLVNDAGQNAYLTNLGVTTDASGVLASGAILRNLADGEDITIADIEIGKADGTGNASIGSLHLVNRSNYYSTMGAVIANAKFGFGLDELAANRFSDRVMKISSKSSGTGAHILTEQGSLLDQGNVGLQTVYYEDTDGGVGGNQVGVIDWMTFRRVNDGDDYNDKTNSGDEIRGALWEYDIDVEDGKLVLSNELKLNSVIVNKIFIGDVSDAINNNIGVLGGISIMNSRWEGSTSYYAH